MTSRPYPEIREHLERFANKDLMMFYNKWQYEAIGLVP